MDYAETIDYLFTAAPLFQHIGSGAYKEGLAGSLALDTHSGHPHRSYATIHIAGTNGKGSCAHTLAAILQSAGLRTGLYTSPHLIDFRERIRVNGKPISRQRVIDFVERERGFFEPLHPSFFELTTALAFKYFEEQEVDIAVIETGLGGRLDCTNIITPILSVITNISLDHTQFLGHTPAEIAKEKAGIIKEGIPVVIGEAAGDVKDVFAETARRLHAPLSFAEEKRLVTQVRETEDGYMEYMTSDWGTLRGELTGECQARNAATILAALRGIIPQLPHPITTEDVRRGFAEVTSLTGLMGRWQTIRKHPAVVCDTGHNPGGWQYLGKRLAAAPCRQLHIVFGMAADKDITSVLRMLPPNARFYFTRASVKRAMDENELRARAQAFRLHGESYPTVEKAYQAAFRAAAEEDLIFVGGSSFVVADLLACLQGTDEHTGTTEKND